MRLMPLCKRRWVVNDIEHFHVLLRSSLCLDEHVEQKLLNLQRQKLCAHLVQCMQAKKDKEKMILQQAAYEELMEEKDRQKRQAKEDRDRERKRIIDKQLADKAAGHAAEIKDMRRLKKALDVQQVRKGDAIERGNCRTA